MIIRRPTDIASSEITPESVYLNRRTFIAAAGVGAAALAAAPAGLRALGSDDPQEVPARFQGMRSELNESLNSYRDITAYNNFYEFGTGKGDPSDNAGDFKPRPWTVSISGEVNKPGDYQLEDILAPVTLEDRVYRLRCVEAWSMVIPWRGFPLYELINRVEPTGNAKFVEFRTIVRPEEMPGQRAAILRWPYVEGLRMDEALHPLTLMVTGVYGMDAPNQNGAPLRLIVPWKYGFKGVKSIVSIRFVEEMPLNTWQQENSFEYGFYANVNPEVDHPRWSQARERRLPTLFQNHPTLMFNGYADQVAHMYAGMDLERWK
ncbi:MAG: protein-methionine-sulfoxide reductase catalytic subunit MsrP [Gemmatimonadetes bacterium]|nr:protein-methionine-sulfoxide reductase catalytic subunit MsrP [Gemmatimonadota bacterium]